MRIPEKEPGCDWIVAYHQDRHVKEKVPEHCGKLREPGWSLCPKHVLFQQDEIEEKKRRSIKAIQTRNLKTLKEEALAASPLRAFNPEFDKPKEKTGYEL